MQNMFEDQREIRKVCKYQGQRILQLMKPNNYESISNIKRINTSTFSHVYTEVRNSQWLISKIMRRHMASNYINRANSIIIL